MDPWPEASLRTPASASPESAMALHGDVGQKGQTSRSKSSQLVASSHNLSLDVDTKPELEPEPERPQDINAFVSGWTDDASRRYTVKADCAIRRAHTPGAEVVKYLHAGEVVLVLGQKATFWDEHGAANQWVHVASPEGWVQVKNPDGTVAVSKEDRSMGDQLRRSLSSVENSVTEKLRMALHHLDMPDEKDEAGPLTPGESGQTKVVHATTKQRVAKFVSINLQRVFDMNTAQVTTAPCERLHCGALWTRPFGHDEIEHLPHDHVDMMKLVLVKPEHFFKHMSLPILPVLIGMIPFLVPLGMDKGIWSSNGAMDEYDNKHLPDVFRWQFVSMPLFIVGCCLYMLEIMKVVVPNNMLTAKWQTAIIVGVLAISESLLTLYYHLYKGGLTQLTNSTWDSVFEVTAVHVVTLAIGSGPLFLIPLYLMRRASKTDLKRVAERNARGSVSINAVSAGAVALQSSDSEKDPHTDMIVNHVARQRQLASALCASETFAARAYRCTHKCNVRQHVSCESDHVGVCNWVARTLGHNSAAQPSALNTPINENYGSKCVVCVVCLRRFSASGALSMYTSSAHSRVVSNAPVDGWAHHEVNVTHRRATQCARHAAHLCD